MKSSRFKLICIVIALGSNPAIAVDSDVIKFQKLYDSYHSVVVKRDRNGIMGFLAPDFTSVELSDKVQSADEMISDLMALLPSATSVDRTTTVLSASGDGETESVEQTFHIVKSKTDTNGKAYELEINAHSHDVWVFASGKWLLKSTRTDELQMKRNGVEVMLKKRPAP